MKDRKAVMAELFAELLVGRGNAIPVSKLCIVSRSSLFHPPLAGSTVRARIHELQAAGFPVLSSPRAGVWIAADDGEVLEVLEEMRETVTAIEHRMQLINGGKCALRSCRADLTKKIRNRGGLYCRPEHRYKAAVERGAS